jgi:hypothetical protein
MAYLVLNDYKNYIQGDYLRQLQQGDDTKRTTEENTSIQAIAQRLTQKYDLDSEFTSMLPYDSTKVYGAAQRVTVDIATNGFRAWVTTTAYTPGALVIEASVGYICTTANNDATFTVANWTSVGPQHSIYYGAYPSTCTLNGDPNPATMMEPYAPVFNYKNLYNVGDVVYWKGYTYVCNQASTVLSHSAVLQYTKYTNLPYSNVFPDDQQGNANAGYWKTKAPYTIPAATLLTNNKWVAGDNRNQTIKDAMVRITVFKLSPLIAPKNRPDVWLDEYRSILTELNNAAEGKITMILPLKQPNNALRTHYGGNIKNQNNY